jgi:hypothetical protein
MVKRTGTVWRSVAGSYEVLLIKDERDWESWSSLGSVDGYGLADTSASWALLSYSTGDL